MPIPRLLGKCGVLKCFNQKIVLFLTIVVVFKTNRIVLSHHTKLMGGGGGGGRGWRDIDIDVATHRLLPSLLNLLHPHDGGDSSHVHAEARRHGLERQALDHDAFPDGLASVLREYRLALELPVVGKGVDCFGTVDVSFLLLGQHIIWLPVLSRGFVCSGPCFQPFAELALWSRELKGRCRRKA